ncbi:hypothetical protein PBV87_17345 [Niameybacter massiliensis]|uniref:Uncharacterized protein n=1 Tax=Holtiella tumoricola TaxID=3018743 RepID=A0AA42J2M5_9FIRM|nr:hypothetical protein [Holtiella tumoricola]MDA3733246.1 hypothetical protein [Holtiella tumoricola]
MKRCPNCNFPNIDSDRNCFKCGSLLPTDSSHQTNPAIETKEANQSTESNTTTENVDKLSDTTTTEEATPSTPTSKATQKTKVKKQATRSKESTTSEITKSDKASTDKEIAKNDKVPTNKEAIKDDNSSTSKETTKDDSPSINREITNDNKISTNKNVSKDATSTEKGEFHILKAKIESDELIPQPNPVFDSNTNITDFIRKPTQSDEPSSFDDAIVSTTNTNHGQASSKDATLANQEVAATGVPLPTTPVPSLTTSPPRPGTPVRITPKYGSLARLKVISKILGVLFGLALFAGGGLTLYAGQNMLSLIICVGLVGLGILNMFLGFVIGATLEWLNDVECNQRKQIELISHVYHKINN